MQVLIEQGLLLPGMKARDFCREWFGVDPEQERVWGYRRRCVELLSRVIGLEQDTIERWGSGVDFDKMPSQYENTLAYAIALKRVMDATSVGCNGLIDLIQKDREVK